MQTKSDMFVTEQTRVMNQINKDRVGANLLEMGNISEGFSEA